MANRLCQLALFILFLLIAILPLQAHSLGVARVELQEKPSAHYQLWINLPSAPEFLQGRPQLPNRCQWDTSPSAMPRSGIVIRRFNFHCFDSPLKAADILHLPWPREGAFVVATWQNGETTTHFFPALQGQPSKGVDLMIQDLKSGTLSVFEVAQRYFGLGIEHILTGWDHLAFVLCLCLIARGWSLVKLVTGFTLGHSLSLAMATFNLIRVPAPPIEACIALSIAFMARESLLPSVTKRHEVGLVCAFGLLHGLGFASALKEVGIGTAELLVGLLTFNLGVETGQLLFVMVVMTLIGWGSKLQIAHQIHQAITYGVGILGIYWLLERIASFREVPFS
ncbi:MAG: HupE/UreJ family protein [Snowella sp.]|nr:HupE/UreJ family protein [Snowella sp.]